MSAFEGKADAQMFFRLGGSRLLHLIPSRSNEKHEYPENYSNDQGDEAAGLLEQDAVDGDNVIIRSNGSGSPDVTAFEGGTEIQINNCRT